MSDIDFDELDKAVNNLMTNVDTPERNERLDDPADKIVTLGGSTTLDSGPSVNDQVISKAAPQTNSATISVANSISSAPALAVKRRGQFMDVMHPSSDMKTVKSIKREGISLTPAASESRPIDPVVDASTLVEEPEPQAAIPDPAANTVSISEPAPLTSPFLPDAKPQKRPLGSGTSDTASPADTNLEADLSGDVVDKPREDEITAPSAEQPMLPAELHNDILAVESTVSTIADPLEAPDLQDNKISEFSENQADPSGEVINPVSVPAGGSIQQQYKESPSTGDQTNGSIYDTSNYHQPIVAAPVTKKSSPLKWIILIITLLLLGVVGGVGYFVLTHGLPF